MKEKLIKLPAISDYKSRKEWEFDCWHKILTSKELLNLIVTSHERHDLVLRAAALDAVIAGKSYRQIGRELWLSLQTISGLKKALKESGYRSYLERSKSERKKRKYSENSGAPRIRRPRY